MYMYIFYYIVIYNIPSIYVYIHRIGVYHIHKFMCVVFIFFGLLRWFHYNNTPLNKVMQRLDIFNEFRIVSSSLSFHHFYLYVRFFFLWHGPCHITLIIYNLQSYARCTRSAVSARIILSSFFIRSRIDIFYVLYIVFDELHVTIIMVEWLNWVNTNRQLSFVHGIFHRTIYNSFWINFEFGFPSSFCQQTFVTCLFRFIRCCIFFSVPHSSSGTPWNFRLFFYISQSITGLGAII